MDLKRIELVQSTMKLLQGKEAETAVRFYGRLFANEPALRPLFPKDMAVQQTKFMDTLTFIITQLDRPEMIMAQVKELGQRHANYGVSPTHYTPVARALFWALGQTLGDDFTPEMHDAWQEAYYLLAGAMKESATQ